MTIADKSIKSVIENIVMDVMEYDGTSLSVYCTPTNIKQSVYLTSSFSSLFGLHDFYLKTYNEEILTLKSDAVDGVFGWLLNSHCRSVEINFSTYGNQQEEHCCDTNNFSGITLCFDGDIDTTTFTNSFKFEPFNETYKNRGYEVTDVVELLKVIHEVKPYMTEDYFNKRKLLCNIAGNWKPLVK